VPLRYRLQRWVPAGAAAAAALAMLVVFVPHTRSVPASAALNGAIEDIDLLTSDVPLNADQDVDYEFYEWAVDEANGPTAGAAADAAGQPHTGHEVQERLALVAALSGLAAAALAGSPTARAADPSVDVGLLEFLGSVDSDNKDWHDYLASTDINRVARCATSGQPCPAATAVAGTAVGTSAIPELTALHAPKLASAAAAPASPSSSSSAASSLRPNRLRHPMRPSSRC